VKIRAIRTIALSYQCEPPYGSAGGMQARRGSLIVEIETDSGITGIGEAGTGGGPPAVTQAVVEKELAPLLIGEDPLLIEGHWQKVFVRTRTHGRRGIIMNALSGIDIALWDIAGKIAGLPLYKLLGACRDKVEAYASGGFYQAGKGVAELAAEAESYRARGFRGMKMKIGRNPSTGTPLRGLTAGAEICEVDPSEDIARVAAVRKALGPNAKLMVDINGAWSPAFAIEMGRALEPYHLYWIEEPVATDDIDGSAEVARALATPVAGYETEVGLYGFRELIARGAVDIVQPDIGWSGGFSECRRIAALAAAYHKMVAPHAFASAVTLAASLHFAAATPNALVLELDQNPHALRDELLKEPLLADRDGFMRPPERPGLGIELDPAALDRYRAPTLRSPASGGG
jgi:D-galactarolactone cycloisomerase